MKYRARLLFLGLCLGVLLALVPGCQTVNGFGKDLQGWSEKNVPHDEK